MVTSKRRPIVYSDFEDEIGTGTEIEVTGVPVGTDMDRFRAKAQRWEQNHLFT
jgi:type I restriction enzyme R subunit